jgi:hypothetical protein
MDNVVIIILLIILILLVILNHISFYIYEDKQVPYGNCSETLFGCCPDGVNSKINSRGTNCPRYNPGPGYPYPKR